MQNNFKIADHLESKPVTSQHSNHFRRRLDELLEERKLRAELNDYEYIYSGENDPIKNLHHDSS